MRDSRESNIVDATQDLVGGDTASFKPLKLDDEGDDEEDLYLSDDEGQKSE